MASKLFECIKDDLAHLIYDDRLLPYISVKSALSARWHHAQRRRILICREVRRRAATDRRGRLTGRGVGKCAFRLANGEGMLLGLLLLVILMLVCMHVCLWIESRAGIKQPWVSWAQVKADLPWLKLTWLDLFIQPLYESWPMEGWGWDLQLFKLAVQATARSRFHCIFAIKTTWTINCLTCAVVLSHFCLSNIS